jgi:phytoene synthase
LSRDTSFYYSFLVLPAAKRDAIIAVWDFCRAVDDAVDEPGMADPAASLEGWRAEIGRCFSGAPQTRQGRNLQPFIERFTLPRRPPRVLLARGVHRRADLRRDFRVHAAGVA